MDTVATFTAKATRARYRIAEAMITQGATAAPIQHPWQSVDRALKSIVGPLMARDEDQRELQREKAGVESIKAGWLK